VSLNTIVSRLSTFAKGCILLLLSRSIGQLKWICFRSRRQRLSDLRTFDSASRGALGSAELLWMQKGNYVDGHAYTAVDPKLNVEQTLSNLRKCGIAPLTRLRPVLVEPDTDGAGTG